MEISAKYKQALASIPPTGSGCHCSLLGVANLGIMSGLNNDQILSDVRSSISEVNRRVPVREITDTIRRARMDTRAIDGTAKWTPAPKRKPVERVPYNFAANLIRKGDGAEEADFWEASPIRLYDDPAKDARLLLEALYRPEDGLFIGDAYSTAVKPVSEWLDTDMTQYPHFIPNPLTGNQHECYSGTMSYRCDAAVADYRFAVVEFDTLSKADQFAFWAAIALPVAALIDSGGKSIHGLIRAHGIATAKEWELYIRCGLYEERLIPCGVDPACRNESRLSRLPGHLRGDNYQKLLYLDPAPTVHSRGILI